VGQCVRVVQNDGQGFGLAQGRSLRSLSPPGTALPPPQINSLFGLSARPSAKEMLTVMMGNVVNCPNCSGALYGAVSFCPFCGWNQTITLAPVPAPVRTQSIPVSPARVPLAMPAQVDDCPATAKPVWRPRPVQPPVPSTNPADSQKQFRWAPPVHKARKDPL
jgi:hypothetical protein